MNEASKVTLTKVELHADPGRALVACGVWTGLGFVGASLAGAAVALLASAQGNPAATLASAAGAVVLALFAWGRAGSLLEGADAASRAGDDAAPAAATRLSTSC